MDILLECVFASWTPTIGDPTVLGWTTVVAYALVSILLWVIAHGNEGRERLLWRLCALFLAVLCVNKQLDLQSFLTAAGRCHAQQSGWYDDRRALQEAFILGIVGFAVLLLVVMVSLLRQRVGRNLLLLFGMVTLCAFIVIRAAGAHKFDTLISQKLGPFDVNHVLELGGIAILVLACILRRHTQRREHMLAEAEKRRLAKRRREMVQK